ncbi:hypothetical protein T484DRAFT_3092178 [Baffinella frigidus]|nr:hypothetical protein T484DRAFT_3092178 [Cryptophyta sp. CCMP2293]
MKQLLKPNFASRAKMELEKSRAMTSGAEDRFREEKLNAPRLGVEKPGGKGRMSTFLSGGKSKTKNVAAQEPQQLRGIGGPGRDRSSGRASQHQPERTPARGAARAVDVPALVPEGAVGTGEASVRGGTAANVHVGASKGLRGGSRGTPEPDGHHCGRGNRQTVPKHVWPARLQVHLSPNTRVLRRAQY